MSEKKVGKRLLTWVLVLVMTLSLLPLNVLADEAGEDSVVYGHNDGSGWVEDDGTGTDPITNVPGVDSVSKTAVRVGNPEDNTYRVTLQVQMHTTTTTQTSYDQAATVLVIDTSGSMGDNGKLTAAKNAAISFLDSYRKGAGRLVALVSFSDGAKEAACGWMDVSTDNGYHAIVDAINTLSADGGTNLEQGLDKAQGLLGNSTIPGTASKNIIALTDGKPTYYNEPYDHYFMGIYVGTYPDGDGRDCDKETFEATKGRAEGIRAMGYSLYSICFAAGNEKLTVPKGVGNSNGHQKISLLDYLSTYIAPGKTYPADDFSGLKTAFDAISTTITSGLSSGKVHDSLPTGVTSSAFPNGTAGVNWDLKDFEKVEEKVGDTTTYTYTKRYTVTIDPTAVDAEQYDGYCPLNGPTTLTVKDSNGQDVQIDFPIPAGKVTLPKQEYSVTYKFTGLPENGTNLPPLPTDSTVYYSGDEVTIQNPSTTTYTFNHKIYTFEGWKLNGTPVSGKYSISDSSLEFVGNWSSEDEPSYSVTYRFTGLPENGTNLPPLPTDSTVYYSGDEVTIQNPSTTTYTFNHKIYTFEGWKLNGTPVSGKYSISDSSLEFVGNWSSEDEPSYTVTYNLSGGTSTSTQLVFTGLFSGDKTPTIKTPTRAGYTFTGWSPKVAETVTGNAIYTAQWTRNYVPYYPPVPPTVKIEDDDALGLNTTDHFAYIVGYGNGEVRPQNNITRAEVATIFFRLLTDDVRDENLTKTNRYSDVAVTSWYNTAVSTLSSMGIITGYPDGTFRPNAAITRAEFAAIAARFDNDGDKTAAKFSDIATHWAKDEISIAYNNGWITGYPDGTFGPQRDITRAETMTLVNRVLNRQPETEDDLLPNMTVWTDNANPKAWYYLAVQEATNSHYYEFKTNSQYEKWTELRETRDWTQLEK